jgi:hypothetical protein
LSCSATRWPKQDTKRFLPSQLDSAFAQAYTSASFKIDTTALVERSKTVPVLASLFKLPHLLLLSGGIAINVGDEVVGAPGAAGAPGGDFVPAAQFLGKDAGHCLDGGLGAGIDAVGRLQQGYDARMTA